MGDRSAGVVAWRRGARGDVLVLLGHLGGPFWERKDDGAWSIPKGLPEPGESDLDAARREFVEELGLPLPDGELVELGEIRQSPKKTVTAWAIEVGDADSLELDSMASNTFEIEWPPRSGRRQEFPEIDRVEWCDLDTAARRMVNGQAQLLDRLAAVVR